MREDLFKILNFKLKQIKDNIDNLNELNEKINDENENLKFIQNAINIFKGEEHGFDIYKFANIERETFNKLLMNLSDEVLTKFGTNSCNYDGLIYLINGINNGISLTLTQEQTDAINLFIDKLLEKEKEYQEIIEKLVEDKQKIDIKDLDILKGLENKYSLIIDNIEDKKYVTEIDEIVEAINYSEISNENAFDILCYLLKYNSEIHKENNQIETEEKEAEVEEEKIDLTKPFTVEEPTEDAKSEFAKIDYTNEDEETRDIENDEIDVEENHFKLSNDEIHDEDDYVESKSELEETEYETTEEEKNIDNSYQSEYNPILPSFDSEGYYQAKLETNNINEFDNFENQSIDVILPNIELELPSDDEEDEESTLELENNVNEIDNNLDGIDTFSEERIELKETDVDFENATDELENNVAFTPVENTFEKTEVDIENEVNDTNINEKNIEIENTSNMFAELVSLFESYDLDISLVDKVTKSMLLKGNLDDYKDVLLKLNETELLKYLKNNNELLVQFILYSNRTIIDNIEEIVKNDLSVDNNDRSVTLEILFKTMPSVFIASEEGNYDNFINNIELLKNYGIDLINLFDFSREVFVADNNLIANNYEMVRNYDLTVNAYNAKYLLLLPNVGSKIDYYVESMYKDNSENGHNQVFDGLEMIKLYPSRLNTVNNETIERLRFSSENGLKVFGSKEKSIAGEIANLNVNIINVTDEFKKSLFNNEFDIIARDEVEKYIELVNTNEVVEMNEDELLNKLSGYRVGMRYFIGNIKVSANKVIRNYNILINNDIDKKKALLFAICYNLVITKTEYERLKSFVNGLGGN